ncbi:aspartyl aminopeptidase [Scenedesmus sp. PABB004]|nr:aspartyl aminopeptidase [Scenedesmus sp. PABB004]
MRLALGARRACQIRAARSWAATQRSCTQQAPQQAPQQRRARSSAAAAAPSWPRGAAPRRSASSTTSAAAEDAAGPMSAADAAPAAAPGAVSPEEARARATDMLAFINAAWTPYHAVEEASRRLLAAGFTHIAEKDAWALKPGGKYFFTRNMSTLVAFAIGARFAPGGPFYMVGAHTDSPCLKVKPVSRSASGGCQTVGVETYGGGLWYTWFDRDLGLAGRVLVRDGAKLTHRLVKVDRPVLRIPMLAIHLQRNLYTEGFKPNFQDHLKPVLCTVPKPAPAAATAADGAPAPAPAAAPPAPAAGPPGDVTGAHHAALLELVSRELGCAPGDIVDMELTVCDVQPGVLGGAGDEFVFAGRLDNLASCYTALEALIDSVAAPDALDGEAAVRSVAMFDHEEVGSDSAQGAGGPVMRDTITRVARQLAQGEEGAVERTLRQSFLVSADMAHALHPNYTDKHEPLHAPSFHGGLVIKHNANQRYATNALSAALFREVGRRAGAPTQEFCVRNDVPCGSTIGPILAHALGCRTVDVGMPQLSMHSIREMCGAADVALAHRHFLAFFTTFSELDASLDVDSLPPPDIKGTIREPACSHAVRSGTTMSAAPAGKRRAGPTTRARAAAAAAAGEALAGAEAAPSPLPELPEPLVLHVLSFLPPALRVWAAKLVCKAARERFRGARRVSLRCPDLPLAAVQEAWRAAGVDEEQQSRLAEARAACGDVAGLAWLRGAGCDDLAFVALGAARAGQLAVLEWARDEGLDLQLVCEGAAMGGQLCVLRWARAQTPPLALGDLVCLFAAERGDLEMLRWARAQAEPALWDERACVAAARKGHLAVLEWASGEGLDLRGVCTGAAWHGQLAVLRWARAQTPPLPWGTHVCYYAARRGDLEMPRWARAQGEPAPWNEWVCGGGGGAANGHLEALRWLRANGCPWERAKCERSAAWRRDEAMLAWIQAQPDPHSAPPFESHRPPPPAARPWPGGARTCGRLVTSSCRPAQRQAVRSGTKSAAPASKRHAGPTTSAHAAAAAAAGEALAGVEAAASALPELPEPLVLHVLGLWSPALQAWAAKLVCKAARERFRGARRVSLRCPDLPLAAVREAWRAAQDGPGQQQLRLARARAACGDVAGLAWLRGAGCDMGRVYDTGRGIMVDGMVWAAARAGQLAVLEWARGEGLDLQDVCRGAAEGGRMTVLRWARAQAPPLPWGDSLFGVCHVAARRGDLEVLRWARAQAKPAPWSDKVCQFAAANGHLEVLRWLRANGCRWRRAECEDVAADHGREAVVAWIRAQPE